MLIEELRLLKAHSLRKGARGAAAIDKTAMARVVTAIDRLRLGHPEIVKIDVNPLVVFGEGKVPVALERLLFWIEEKRRPTCPLPPSPERVG